jgi:lipopolysaccharide biosynthesis protein
MAYWPEVRKEYDVDELLEDRAAMPGRVRFIAFYLTQFHPVPENDLWWGKGFTEWTNVTKAKPLFEGHDQPHLPTDLGFYDLRLREVRHDQIALAKQYGIDGFCYHYYWFSGKRMLHAPLDDMLADPGSDMPFCLCWANENWTRRWDGADREILLAQRHLPDDDLNFIQSIVPFFRDRRYIRFNDAPFFIVYHPQQLRNARKSLGLWRDYCRSVGIEKIHISAALTHGNEEYQRFGFDSGVEFPPHNFESKPVRKPILFHVPFKGVVLSYEDIAHHYLAKRYANPNVFRTVFPCWDNTPRSGERGLVVLDGTPANYEHWLFEALCRTQREFPGSERFVFINAWNEWAEGCHLEPDRKHQRGFLEATLRAKSGRPESFRFESMNLTSAGPRRTLSRDFAALSRYHSYAALRNLREWLNNHPRLQHIVRRARAALRFVSSQLYPPPR